MMRANSSAIKDPLAFAVGVTLAGVGFIALYLANAQKRRQRWRGNNKTNMHRLVDGDACRYPFVARDRDRLRSPSAVRQRFGKDGRRSLHGSTMKPREDVVYEQEEAKSTVADHRGHALSSTDIFLHALHYLDRRDVMACSTVSTLFRATATDDTIWIHYTKEYTANLLCGGEVGPAFLMQAGLDRVMDLLYAQLPKAYVEIYPHLQPTREVHSSRMMARKSWHRWWLTMAWVQHLQRQKRAASENTGYPRIEALDIESNSFKAVDRFGTAFFFPEQILSFVSNLYRACCADFWEELLEVDSKPSHRDAHGAFLGVPYSGCNRAPLWGDMLAVLNGFLRLYQGRDFVVWKDNMGFLLQDPDSATTPYSSEQGPDEQSSDVDPASLPRRQLRIPCTHGLFVQTLAKPVKRLHIWPYSKHVTLEGLLAHLTT